MKRYLDEVEPTVPAFAPRVVKIKVREDEAVTDGVGDDDDEVVRQLTAKLVAYIPELSGVDVSAAEFEKVRRVWLCSMMFRQRREGMSTLAFAGRRQQRAHRFCFCVCKFARSKLQN